jgi:hypothetical protein
MTEKLHHTIVDVGIPLPKARAFGISTGYIDLPPPKRTLHILSKFTHPWFFIGKGDSFLVRCPNRAFPLTSALNTYWRCTGNHFVYRRIPGGFRVWCDKEKPTKKHVNNWKFLGDVGQYVKNQVFLLCQDQVFPCTVLNQINDEVYIYDIKKATYGCVTRKNCRVLGILLEKECQTTI